MFLQETEEGDLRHRLQYHGDPCKDRGGKGRVAATSQGAPRIDRSPQNLEERLGTVSPSESPEGTNPAEIVIFGLLASTSVNNFLLF